MCNNTLGVYIHFPFCSSKCNYCSFFSVKKSNTNYCNYIKKINRDINQIQTIVSEKNLLVNTLYIGGGTPSLIENEDVLDIISPFKNTSKEITVEVNPCSANRQIFETFALAGVNRISIGVQSLNNKILKYLGRKHSCKMALECIKEASQFFNNISVDFIIGVDFDSRDLAHELEAALKFEKVNHISLYGLSVEKGSAFYAQSIKPDENQFVKDYEEVHNTLTKKYSFTHYEVSNFCKPSFESQHNMKYWLREDYIGIGPAAHSFFMGKRFCFQDNFEDFFNACLLDKFNQGEVVDVQQAKTEKIMLSLRLQKGMRKNLISKEKEGVLDMLVEAGYLKEGAHSISATVKGWQVLNQIIKKLAF